MRAQAVNPALIQRLSTRLFFVCEQGDSCVQQHCSKQARKFLQRFQTSVFS